MKHIAFAVVAAALLAIFGPRITPDNWNMGAQSAAATSAPPASMIRMRAGEAPQPSFIKR